MTTEMVAGQNTGVMEMEFRKKYLRSLPAVDELLRLPQVQILLKNHFRPLVVEAIRKILEEKRRIIIQSRDEGEASSVNSTPEGWASAIAETLTTSLRLSLRPVINATGVVLHTNLGRAPLGEDALRNLVEIGAGYSNLEFDVERGERGSRYEHVEDILCRISGAAAGMVVNNNAAAVLLALNSLADGKEVIVSRGQLVEIGGSFRVPDVMKKSGARLVEVGTTNRTHLRDYEQAITENTALLLKVHTSNYRILGFTSEVPAEDLVSLGRAKGIRVMEDLGSGCFVDLSRWGMESEPTVQAAVRAGVDLVTFSGDKLLGGPQAGIILGSEETVEILKRNALNRALRIDKLTLAALESTLRAYLNPEEALKALPILGMLTCSRAELDKRARRLQAKLAKSLSPESQIGLREENSQVGGGALPLQQLPTRVIALRSLRTSAADLERKLRKGQPPVIVRVKEEEVLIDPRTVAEEEEPLLIEAVRKAFTE